ncbi:hypothetical protein NDU88_003569 [Pleurodeles waltl]|uniref:Uncharacterized protein n=1 Tax=Pleurodeles waltl TaxID=8319 RepID=A0AAV7UFI9_PLEWA|nr:hypothetical protein NDU88_003569 [Pleurodeles waltl]
MKQTNTHLWGQAARPDRVIEAHPVLEVRVLPSSQIVLVSPEVGVFIEYPVATFHSDGVATAEVGAQIGTLSAALIRTALEVPVLIEDDL